MAYVSEMIDQLRDLLSDPNDMQVSFSTKRMYLNLGISAMWPRIWRIVTASDITVVAETYDYALPAGASEHGIVSIELEDGEALGTYTRLAHYDLLPGDEDTVAMLRLAWLPEAGSLIRYRYVSPITPIVATTYATAASETFVGPDKVLGLPVLYAMGLLAVRRMEDYLDASRQRPSNESDRFDVSSLMSSSRMWMNQFEAQVSAMSRPLPVAED